MTDWSAILARPEGLCDDTFHTWFDRIAEQMLNRSRLMVSGSAHRFTEIEFYYHGPDHADAFTHRDSLQKECGYWYLHRSGGTLRNGSFKGLDLTFGGGGAHGGILIRGLETANGRLIDGPSLCVDYLLAASGIDSLAELDRALAGRRAWYNASPLSLRGLDHSERRPLYRTARVGLLLKRKSDRSDSPRYVCRAQRYLSEPRRIAKGRLHLVLALHASGTSADKIRALTGCSRSTLARYVAEFEAGRHSADFAPLIGIVGNPMEQCRMHGVWHAVHGAGVAGAC